MPFSIDPTDRNLMASSALLMAYAHVAHLAPIRTLAVHQRATAYVFAGQAVYSKTYDELVEMFTVSGRCSDSCCCCFVVCLSCRVAARVTDEVF